jgi:hypothetical protein
VTLQCDRVSGAYSYHGVKRFSLIFIRFDYDHPVTSVPMRTISVFICSCIYMYIYMYIYI